MILLGADGKAPVQFVICWTLRAMGSGGTGQGIRIARGYGIRVYDLGNVATEQRFRSRVARRP